MSENKKSKQSAYEQQESKLSAQSVAFIKLLTQRGILGDAEIDDDKIRQAQKEKKRHMMLLVVTIRYLKTVMDISGLQSTVNLLWRESRYMITGNPFMMSVA